MSTFSRKNLKNLFLSYFFDVESLYLDNDKKKVDAVFSAFANMIFLMIN